MTIARNFRKYPYSVFSTRDLPDILAVAVNRKNRFLAVFRRRINKAVVRDPADPVKITDTGGDLPEIIGIFKQRLLLGLFSLDRNVVRKPNRGEPAELCADDSFAVARNIDRIVRIIVVGHAPPFLRAGKILPDLTNVGVCLAHCHNYRAFIRHPDRAEEKFFLQRENNRFPAVFGRYFGNIIKLLCFDRFANRAEQRRSVRRPGHSPKSRVWRKAGDFALVFAVCVDGKNARFHAETNQRDSFSVRRDRKCADRFFDALRFAAKQWDFV